MFRIRRLKGCVLSEFANLSHNLETFDLRLCGETSVQWYASALACMSVCQCADWYADWYAVLHYAHSIERLKRRSELCKLTAVIATASPPPSSSVAKDCIKRPWEISVWIDNRLWRCNHVVVEPFDFKKTRANFIQTLGINWKTKNLLKAPLTSMLMILKLWQWLPLNGSKTIWIHRKPFGVIRNYTK